MLVITAARKCQGTRGKKEDKVNDFGRDTGSGRKYSEACINNHRMQVRCLQKVMFMEL